jgi:hypothetical protein
MPVGAGVVEEPWQWSVSPELYAAVAVYAKPRGLTLLGVVHTHLSRNVPRLSRTDRVHSLKVADALAIIIGSAGEEQDPERWGWFIYTAADGYRALSQPDRAERLEMTDGPSEFIEVTAGASV